MMINLGFSWHKKALIITVMSLIISLAVTSLVRLPPAADSATKPPLTSIIIPPPEEIANSNGISIQDAPIAVSGNNTYVAWPNNDTGHWNVFFAKSIDNGKTFTKIIRLSSSNVGSTIDENTQIAANGKNVYVTWWTNKTGVLKPVFRASNDNGDAFGRLITLNSTSITIITRMV